MCYQPVVLLPPLSDHHIYITCHLGYLNMLHLYLGSLVFPICVQTRDCCWPRTTLTGVGTLTVASVYITMQFLGLK